MRNKTYVIANWKMNPETYHEAEIIFDGTVSAVRALSNKKSSPRLEVVVCMPYTWLTDFSHKKNQIVAFGAQDAALENTGPHTGEVSPAMLAGAGVKYVILGHSERREMGETNELIAQKVAASLKTGLRVVLCIGEKARDISGDYLLFLRSELGHSLAGVPKRLLKKLIIAYEPVWAIGKGEEEAMSPRDLHVTSIFIKKVLNEIYGHEGMDVPILYGGSVSHKNAKELLELGDVKGLLVGRESLKPKKFEALLGSLA